MRARGSAGAAPCGTRRSVAGRRFGLGREQVGEAQQTAAIANLFGPPPADGYDLTLDPTTMDPDRCADLVVAAVSRAAPARPATLAPGVA
ncbi:MAG: hypothetical protein WAM30_04405 [Candidatus Dormiibacterota bacterium]